MNKGLFLDDVRMPEDVVWVKLPDIEWIIVRSYNQFVNEIQVHGIPSFISMDHDLGLEDYIDPQEIEEDMIFTERNGYDCAKWLIAYCLEHKRKLPEYVVHSMNCVGKANITNYLENAKKHCEELK